jgi:uncharacterized protein (TIGR02145 family)
MRTLTTITTTALYLAQSLVSPVQGQGCTSVTDIDGNVYPAVIIGDQCWMAENLRTATYRDGTPIPNGTAIFEWENLNSGACCNLFNNSGLGATYGKLYNWYAAANPNICPQGWHVPTDDEWKQLETALGMPAAELNVTDDFRGEAQNVGGKMKKDTTLWTDPNTGATNESGFSGLPGGRRWGGSDTGLMGVGYWWSASESSAQRAWMRMLSNSNAGIYVTDYEKSTGFSVRCVQNAIGTGLGEREPVRFTLAPNPTNERVGITFGQHAQPRHITLLDATGRVVLEHSIANSSGPVSLDLSGHENGLYFVQVQFMDGTRAVERIVKE